MHMRPLLSVQDVVRVSVMCVVPGIDVEGRRQIVLALIEDEMTTHEQWLDVVHLCQVYGYHDCLSCPSCAYCTRCIMTDSSPRCV